MMQNHMNCNETKSHRSLEKDEYFANLSQQQSDMRNGGADT